MNARTWELNKCIYICQLDGNWTPAQAWRGVARCRFRRRRAKELVGMNTTENRQSKVKIYLLLQMTFLCWRYLFLCTKSTYVELFLMAQWHHHTGEVASISYPVAPRTSWHTVFNRSRTSVAKLARIFLLSQKFPLNGHRKPASWAATDCHGLSWKQKKSTSILRIISTCGKRVTSFPALFAVVIPSISRIIRLRYS